MPHMPRRYATTIGVPPELQHRPVDSHPAIPIRSTPPAQEERAARLSLSLGKLNLRTYEPDFNQLLKTMFGREASVDPYTQQLVLARPAPAAAPFGAQQAPADNAK